MNTVAARVSSAGVGTTTFPSVSRVSMNTVAARVSYALDGDSLVVRGDGRTTTVRLLGIDAPEGTDRCFGKAARVRVQALVRGKTVRLQADPTQDQRDRYGRLLAYVTTGDGSLLNEQLLREGMAFEYTFRADRPYLHRAAFLAAAAEARAAGRGVWSCPAPPTIVAAGAAPCRPGQFKANRRTGIVHAPGQRSYAPLRRNVSCFDSLMDARAAGFRPNRS